jgi:Domain of unknown function (DUF397)
MASSSPLWGGRDSCDLDSAWRKSSYSESNGHCVEFARLVDGRIGVRDSKVANGPILRVEPESWSTFVRALRDA